MYATALHFMEYDISFPFKKRLDSGFFPPKFIKKIHLLPRNAKNNFYKIKLWVCVWAGGGLKENYIIKQLKWLNKFEES